jgi:Ca2+/Na+ antiporter
MTTIVRRSPVLVFGVVVGLVIGAAELVGGGTPVAALVSAVIPIGYAAIVTVVAGRSETVSVLAGRPVDERWQHINLEATAWALGATAIVVLVAFVVTDAARGDWTPYAFIGAVMAVAYLGSLAIVRARH